MKKLFLLFVILVTCPVFAACPIDSEGAACAAEFQNNLPDIIQPKSVPSSQPQANIFSETPAAVNSDREMQPSKNLRSFGANNQDYGYNSNCQFGVCMDTGMPKIFPSQNNSK